MKKGHRISNAAFINKTINGVFMALMVVAIMGAGAYLVEVSESTPATAWFGL